MYGLFVLLTLAGVSTVVWFFNYVWDAYGAVTGCIIIAAVSIPCLLYYAFSAWRDQRRFFSSGAFKPNASGPYSRLSPSNDPVGPVPNIELGESTGGGGGPPRLM